MRTATRATMKTHTPQHSSNFHGDCIISSNRESLTLEPTRYEGLFAQAQAYTVQEKDTT